MSVFFDNKKKFFCQGKLTKLKKGIHVVFAPFFITKKLPSRDGQAYKLQ